jgi:hypothetical protein
MLHKYAELRFATLRLSVAKSKDLLAILSEVEGPAFSSRRHGFRGL